MRIQPCNGGLTLVLNGSPAFYGHLSGRELSENISLISLQVYPGLVFSVNESAN